MAMTEGMLWFQPEGDMWTAIDHAARHYHEKMNRWPNCCYMNALDWERIDKRSAYLLETVLEEGIRWQVRIRILPIDTHVQMQHLWIGVNDEC